MKKHLLFGLSVCICTGATAQTQLHAVKQNTTNGTYKMEGTVPSFYNVAKKKPAKENTLQRSTTTRTKFSSSYNAYGLLVTESSPLTADQATNTISFTHRISQDWAVAGVNSGFIQSTFTNNGGITWDSILLVQDQVNLCRYPSATLFNPTGNTATDSLFSIVAGPITNGTDWIGNYFASSQLNDTNNNVNIKLNATPGVPHQDFVRIGMQSAGNKVIVTGGLYANANGTTAVAQKYRGASINIGTFDSINNFTWAVDSIKPDFFLSPTDGSAETHSLAQTAWSQNGMVGYVIFSAVDSSATGGELAYQPMVWKTVNGGISWVKMPLTDFSAIPSINAKLIPSSSGTKKAWYTQSSGMDAAVDANDNLHIVNVIASGSSDAPDSLGYTWTTSNNISYIYDTYTTSTGWNAILVDSLLCVEAKASSPFSGGTPVESFTIDARIQVSRTTDGTHLFYFWTDSDPTAINGENALPDIKGRGLNITTNLLTPTISFTNDGLNFYMYASNIALVNGSTYSIAATNSNSRDGSGNTDITFDHFFVSGIQFVETDFTIGVAENAIKENQENGYDVNLYPNPAGNSVKVLFNLSNVEKVNVKIYTVVGQEVNNFEQELAPGKNTLTINLANYKPGIYFVRSIIQGKVITKKLVVE